MSLIETLNDAFSTFSEISFFFSQKRKSNFCYALYLEPKP